MKLNSSRDTWRTSLKGLQKSIFKNRKNVFKIYLIVKHRGHFMLKLFEL